MSTSLLGFVNFSTNSFLVINDFLQLDTLVNNISEFTPSIGSSLAGYMSKILLHLLSIENHQNR